MNYIAIFISSIQQHILEVFTMGADELKAKILFTNGRIIDGTGRYVKRGHVGIEGESIVSVQEDTDIPSY